VSSFAAWKVDASLVGPGVLLWVRKPRDTTKRGSTHDHWFVVVDVAPPGRIVAGTKLHIVGISSHPQDMAAAVPMETAGTPLKGECYACLDWELDDRLLAIESDEEGWDYEIRGAQLDRWDASHAEPRYVDLNWFTKKLLPAREKYHRARQSSKRRSARGEK